MELIIKELTPDLLEDFLNFFDNIAFSDNPEWGGCYCHFYHFAGNMEQWGKCTKEHNRNATVNLIKDKVMTGFLAFMNNEPVGWCNVNSKEVYKKTPTDIEPEDNLKGNIASVVCFLIAPAYRKKGVARKLLNHAIEILKEKDIAWIEAYPRKGDLSDAHSYHGPVSLFSSEGFTIIREDEYFFLMRKSLE
ncbi:MAG: GNAT family N-acetyltransferase [Candidatus Lokiarchaeota archaeon]|nr:GNAT family N-acetyltransferase [Candidatus Lokiarchaeota archaeon]